MGRPRAFEPDAVVAAAGELFWERGYQGTSIGDLEAGTGLDRSSLYHAFGNKQALFERAARVYVDENIGGRLGGMLREDAGLADVVDFFHGMARTFRADPAVAARGCLIVNTLGELTWHQPQLAKAGAAYRDRFRAAFSAALAKAAARGEMDGESVDARARLLTSITMGLFVTARIDPADAADVSDGAANEIAAWRTDSPI